VTPVSGVDVWSTAISSLPQAVNRTSRIWMKKICMDFMVCLILSMWWSPGWGEPDIDHCQPGDSQDIILTFI
jgi:hypothetical protein